MLVVSCIKERSEVTCENKTEDNKRRNMQQ